MSKVGVVSRRDVLRKGSAAALVGAVPSVLMSKRVRAQVKQLKILQWKHFVPGYDTWFNESYVKEWGEKNQVDVIVENIGLGDLGKRAAEEAAAGHGHDLVQVVSTPADFEDFVVDHRELYEECERRYGKVAEFALKTTLSPKTGKHFGFCSSYAPALVSYRKDLWDSVQSGPGRWEDVLSGGRRIKLLHEKPVGISLAAEHNGEHALRALLHSFGAAEQDEDGNPALKSPATLEALRYVKSLYEEAMTSDVLSWDAASNNRFMLNGEGSLTLDTISIARASEKLTEPVAGDLRLAAPPEGPAGRLGPAFGFYTYFIWKFSPSIELAKQFIVDYVGQSREVFIASGFQNMPTLGSTVPDLAEVAAADPGGGAQGKYSVLAQASSWTTNFGAPGYTHAGIIEVYESGVISRMFARVATGEVSAEDALAAADGEIGMIFQKWRDRGKL